MTIYNRRATDKISEEIMELIKKEDSEAEKGKLLILYQISDLINSNTKLVNEIHTTIKEQHKTFTAYREKNTEYINKGKGAWKVLAIALILFKGLIISAAAFAYSDYKELKAAVLELKQEIKLSKKYLLTK